MNNWGKDHWSTLLYLETCAVDNFGAINNQKMRCDPRLHFRLAHQFSTGAYPTIMADGTEVPNHDDWSCAEEMEELGLLTLEMDGRRDKVKVTLTDKGFQVVSALRQYRAEHRTTNGFVPPDFGLHVGSKVRVKAHVRTRYGKPPFGTVIHIPGNDSFGDKKLLVRYVEKEPIEGLVIGYSFRSTGWYQKGSEYDAYGGIPYLLEDIRHKVWLVEPGSNDKYIKPYACLGEDLEVLAA